VLLFREGCSLRPICPPFLSSALPTFLLTVRICRYPSTKHFSDGREPQETVDRQERELSASEIQQRRLDVEVRRLYEERKRHEGDVDGRQRFYSQQTSDTSSRKIAAGSARVPESAGTATTFRSRFRD
jgi:hypothetical protein